MTEAEAKAISDALVKMVEETLEEFKAGKFEHKRA